MSDKNPFENKPRLVLPLWTWMDEFEEFLVMWNNMFHVSDWIEEAWEWWTDAIYHYTIDWNDIIVQCVFYQTYSRKENEKKRKETTYIAVDRIFAKWIKDIRDANKYEDGKLNKDEKERYEWMKYQIQPHPIEKDKEARTPEAIAKIKSFLFYQTLWKEKAKPLIQNEIDKLWKCSEQDIKDLNEIMETWNIKREKNYSMIYMMEKLKEMAKELEKVNSNKSSKKNLEEVNEIIEQLKNDK